MKTSDFTEFLSTLSHLEPPPDFKSQDTSAYTLSAEFFECIARELDVLLRKEWQSLNLTSDLPSRPFSGLLSFTEYVNDFLRPEFDAISQLIEDQQHEDLEESLAPHNTPEEEDDT